jgi:hypothetical protein
MLEVVTAATNFQLTTLAAVKAELGISGTTEDTLLGSFIDQASAAIVDYCQRPFAQEVYKETVMGYGSNRLMLSRTPIVAVASVTADSEVITDHLIENADAGILYRKLGWQWTAPLGWNVTSYPMSGREELLFAIQYTAGFILPGDATTEKLRTLPQAVEKACIETVKAWYLGRDRDPFMTGQKIGDLQVQYGGGSRLDANGQGAVTQGIPPLAMQLLVPWRRLV